MYTEVNALHKLLYILSWQCHSPAENGWFLQLVASKYWFRFVTCITRNWNDRGSTQNAQCMSFFFLHVQASVLQMLLLFMWQRKMWRRPRGEEIRRRGTYVGVLLTNDFCIVWTWWPVAQYLLYSKVQYIKYAFTVMYMQTSKHNLVFGPDSLWFCAFWEDGEYTLCDLCPEHNNTVYKTEPRATIYWDLVHS